MDRFIELLNDMSAGELIEILLVNKDENMNEFLWAEQVELILNELKTRLKADEKLDVDNVIKVIKGSRPR